MDSNPQNNSGLPLHVMQQLQQASQQISETGQSQRQTTTRGGRRGDLRGGAHRGMDRAQPPNTAYSQHSRQPNRPQHSQNSRNHMQNGYGQAPVSQNYSRSFSRANSQMQSQHSDWNTATPSTNSEVEFPALGSTRSSHHNSTSSNVSSQPQPSLNMTHERAQDFQLRARSGFYRGRNSLPQQMPQARSQQQQFAQQPHYQVQQYEVDDFRRPHPQHSAVYNPMQANMAHPRHSLRKTLALQNEYLETVAEVALRNQMSVEEQQEKEALRLTLERIMRDVITEYGRSKPTIEPNKVKLKCYGSLASGFAVAGSDMDLLVTFPRDGEPTGDLEEDIKRLFEKALLQAGYGARLLTQTRVPIMRVCETPTPEILTGLRNYRAKWEREEQEAADLKRHNIDPNSAPEVTREQIEAVTEMFAELGNTPAETPLPPSPGRELPHLEYTKDCGIQCDINFSNYVALQNTRLLRTYCSHDERVREMGLIVKAWAKARKINTPYHGTLSSYGYILMLLHFLMNVAAPPVIPNLQQIAREQDEWNQRTDFKTVDGFDVRFISDHEQIAALAVHWPRNQETVGSLLCGFFSYYADHHGFHWTNDIISIRSVGGSLTKRSKGWTEAKWTGEKNTVRNRYLLCIEDPFETEHNIARTVCHSGIVAIRDEFRRAKKILERVEKVPNAGWQWLDDNGEPGQSFMAIAEDRGDLLRKDADFHKLKRMRAGVEAVENARREENARADPGAAGRGNKNGMSSHHPRGGDIPLETNSSTTELIKSVGQQQDHSPLGRGRSRQVKPDSDDEGEEEVSTDAKKLHTASNGTTETKSLSASVRDSSSESTDRDVPEPNCYEESVFVPRSVNSYGKLLPWDIGTQEGRWLQWRDNKVRRGAFTGISSPGLRILNEMCPFDPLRPPAISQSGPGHFHLTKPPFPMCRPASRDNVKVKGMMSEDVQSEDVSSFGGSLRDQAEDTTIDDASHQETFSADGNFHELSEGHEMIPPKNTSPIDSYLAEQFEAARQVNINRVAIEPPKPAIQMTKQVRKRGKKRSAAPPRPESPLLSLSDDDSSSKHRLTDQSWMKVQWERSTMFGRWLYQRDKQMKEGTWEKKPLCHDFRRLNAMFPYIENPSLEEQSDRNARLLTMADDLKRKKLVKASAAKAEAEVQEKLANPGGKPKLEVAATLGMAPEEMPKTSITTEPRVLSKMTWERSILGEWCSWRDNKIRQGNWQPSKTQKFYSWLNLTLPYVSKPTLDQQTALNEQVKRIESSHPELKAFDRLGMDGRRPSAQDMVKLLSLDGHHDMSPGRQVQEIESEPTTPAVPAPRSDRATNDLSFLRNQCVQYFTSQLTKTEDGTVEGQNSSSPAQHSTANTEQSMTLPSSIDSRDLAAKSADMATMTSVQASAHSDIANSTTQIPQLIPQTLHQGPPSSCPRDEDPNIMPIPSMPAFAFDARQLRDLTVIQSGGNGCARFGEQWNIEPEDGEWGGGGRMGHRSSSSELTASAGSAQAQVLTVEAEDEEEAAWEKWKAGGTNGNGVTERFFEELPASVASLVIDA